MKSFKYRIFPTKKQEDILLFTLNHCRWLCNTALQQRRDAYKSTGKGIGYHIQTNEMPSLKEQFPEYSQIHSQILQNVLKRVDLAFQSFFRRIKIKLHRDVSGTTKTCTVKREGRHWYIIFSCQTIDIIPGKKVVTKAIGIDLGLSDFAVLSNGLEIKNPKYLRQSEEKLTIIQSKYSKGKSKKVKRKLSNLHQKIARQRNDFQHKLSKKLVDNFDLIAYEDLKIKKMLEDNKYDLQKHIYDACWGKFIFMLKYKAESAGTYCIAVNPKGTTQKCSNCNSIVQKSLYERLHNCPSCGFTASRDYNAALNIHKLGISLVKEGFA